MRQLRQKLYAPPTRKSQLGRAMPFAPALPTQFELTVKRLRLTPQMYAVSRELKRWCESNRDRCYVPEWLLEKWGITVDTTYYAV